MTIHHRARALLAAGVIITLGLTGAAFSEEPFKYLYYYPVPWALIDEHRGYVACEFKMRMADPGDGSVHESSCFSLLHYAGNGLWSYEEDKYDPAELEALAAL